MQDLVKIFKMSRQNPRSCQDIQDPKSCQDFQNPRSCQDVFWGQNNLLKLVFKTEPEQISMKKDCGVFTRMVFLTENAVRRF